MGTEPGAVYGGLSETNVDWGGVMRRGKATRAGLKGLKMGRIVFWNQLQTEEGQCMEEGRRVQV